jgi:hypothetical protein
MIDVVCRASRFAMGRTQGAALRDRIHGAYQVLREREAFRAYWFTTACLQFFPRERRLRVAYGSACQARYQEVSFQP